MAVGKEIFGPNAEEFIQLLIQTQSKYYYYHYLHICGFFLFSIIYLIQQFIIIMKTTDSVTDSDDPQISYLIASWARVCKVLGADFVPYLPIVMPPLMQSAQLKPDFAILDR